ncbi:MAG: hypothetical protein ABII18_12965 [bacterium]|nr:hypothetical protein [bacterium]MBU1916890.1 hypothetical protein [bacterium]
MIKRIIIVISVAFFIAMFLQGIRLYFDYQDMKKAEAQVRSKYLTHMTTFLKISENQLLCEEEVYSRYEGTYLVLCGEKKGHLLQEASAKFWWFVNIYSKDIKPFDKFTQSSL